MIGIDSSCCALTTAEIDIDNASAVSQYRRMQVQSSEQLKLDRQVLLRVLAEVVEHLYEGDMNIL
jgi:hypothetical protein